MLFVLAFALLYLPIRILCPTKIIGKKNLPKKGGYVLTSNHTTNWDAIILDIYLHKKIRFLAKKELFKNKFSGYILKRMGTISVNRDKPEVASFKASLKAIKDKNVLGVFPEGTRNKTDEKLLDIKSGAITFASKGETFILPIIIYNKVRVFHKNYILVGEPFEIVGADPKRLTKEELEQNTNRLTEVMEKLRADFDKQLEEKRKRRKKNGK